MTFVKRETYNVKRNA